MEIGSLNFGKTDAKNDILLDTVEQKEFFINSFLNTPNLQEEKFISGELYLAYGNKGVGKTALLRYISLKVLKNEDVVNFFLFKTHLSEDDKKNIASSTNIEAIDETENIPLDGKDFEEVWKWFFIRKIYEYSKDKHVFEYNNDYQKFSRMMEAICSGTNCFKSLFPKMRKGILKISKNPELELEFEWHDQEKTQIKLSSLVRKMEEVILKLKPYEKKMYIFCDELEISIGNKKSKVRDLYLIRDMICTINRYNQYFRKSRIPVFIIAAIRSEVLSAPECVGKEINKAYEDCGVLIDWSESGTDLDNEPLIIMILKKIKASLKMNEHDMLKWNDFFGEVIHNDLSKKYILHNSWYRPRDIIRMLNLAKEKNPRKTIFDQASFDKTKKKYSERCWVEISEGISTEFGVEGVKFIVDLMTGFKKEFTKEEFQEHINQHDIFSKRPIGFERKPIRFFLEIMYYSGIIGNKMTPEKKGEKGKIRFVFRGDTNFLMSDRYIVHSALRSFFSM